MSEDHRVIKKLREDAASNPLAWLFAHDALELLVYVDRLRAENQRLRGLLVRWMAAYPTTHDVHGDELQWVKDTKKALEVSDE